MMSDETEIYVENSTKKVRAKIWREKNKGRISLYNKMCVDKRRNKKETCAMIYAKKINEDEWKEYKSQLEAATKLKVHASNICHVINGTLQTTGGYEFKIEHIPAPKIDIPSWEQIKKDNNLRDTVKDIPSPYKTLHEEKSNIMGKCCCTCKEWKELTNYNNSVSRWDNLRADCKDCLVTWRKNNRTQISKKFGIYEKHRKLTDPSFKLLKTLRSRLNSALNKRTIKGGSTMDLIGCEILFLKGYLEDKFTEGMSWENHGKWHIDHIRPCASFDLKEEGEQMKCFHYTNLQPLWAKDNLSKGSKY
jgi:hypothetical protein